MSGRISSDDLRKIRRELSDIDDALPRLGELSKAKDSIVDAIEYIDAFTEYLEEA